MRESQPPSARIGQAIWQAIGTTNRRGRAGAPPGEIGHTGNSAPVPAAFARYGSGFARIFEAAQVLNNIYFKFY
jgi:hypothetical protein